MIKLKELLHKPIPRFLYHGTFNANIPSIKSNGLLPGGGDETYINYENTEPGVYLAETPNEAGSFVEASENPDIPEEWFNEIVIITIDTTKLDKNNFDVDPNVISSENEETRPFIYKEIIPPSSFHEITDYS